MLIWGFARRETHLYLHDFARRLVSFLFGVAYKKNKKTPWTFWFTSQNDLEFPPSVCANILVTLL